MPDDCSNAALPCPTSSAAASPARTSATPDDGKASEESAAAFGGNSIALSPRSGRRLSSPKTSLPYALADWTKCSGRSLRSGMMRNGTVYPLPPLALPTGGIASGLLPTPCARDHMPAHNPDYIAEKRAQGHGMANLNDFVAHSHRGLWPMPCASDWKGPNPLSRPTCDDNLPTRVKRAEAGGQLNPAFVEWLMGYPPGWTVCDASATRSSRKFPK